MTFIGELPKYINFQTHCSVSKPECLKGDWVVEKTKPNFKLFNTRKN